MVQFKTNDVIVIMYGKVYFHALIDTIRRDNITLILYNPAEPYINFRRIDRQRYELKIIYIAHICGHDKLRIQQVMDEPI